MSRASFPSLEDDFSRALLGSADADGPSNAAYAKAAAALGIGVGLGVGASLPAPAAVAAGAAGVAGIARWSSSLGAKLLALGVSGGLFVGSGVLLLGGSQPAKVGPVSATSAARPRGEPSRTTPALLSPARQPSVVPAAAPAAAATSSDRASPSVASRPPLPALPALPAHRAARASAHVSAPRAPAAPSPSTRGSTGSSLAEQVQSLDRARVALGSGDSTSALREIARYRTAWPDGVFLTEASVLEIEALAARGERSLARTRAADFVAAHPDSPQADRLRALIPAQKR